MEVEHPPEASPEENLSLPASPKAEHPREASPDEGRPPHACNEVDEHLPRIPLESDARLPRTTRELFDSLPPLPGLRVEIIEGQLIVSPIGTPEHGRHAMALAYALWPEEDENRWHSWAGNVDVCIDGPRDAVVPDYVLAPPDCPRWRDRELLSSGLLMVAEIVSPGSIRQDREDRPKLYATGGIPVYLLIDPVSEPPTATVFSEIDKGAYRVTTTVPLGRTIHLPAPVDVKLDTAIFTK